MNWVNKCIFVLLVLWRQYFEKRLVKLLSGVRKKIRFGHRTMVLVFWAFMPNLSLAHFFLSIGVWNLDIFNRGRSGYWYLRLWLTDLKIIHWSWLFINVRHNASLAIPTMTDWTAQESTIWFPFLASPIFSGHLQFSTDHVRWLSSLSRREI